MKQFELYCDDIESVENYEKAKTDDFRGWDCHHRLETHTSDGDKRAINIYKKELIALGMYFYRPANELIFLTRKEHNRLHNSFKGKHHSDESKKKLSAAHKGKHLSEKTKLKISNAIKGELHPMYGKHHTEEARKKISDAALKRNEERHWYNNGEINKFCYECPEGFIEGRIHLSEKTKLKISESMKERMEEVREAYKKSGRKDWNTFQKEYKEMTLPK